MSKKVSVVGNEIKSQSLVKSTQTAHLEHRHPAQREAHGETPEEHVGELTRQSKGTARDFMPMV